MTTLSEKDLLPVKMRRGKFKVTPLNKISGDNMTGRARASVAMQPNPLRCFAPVYTPEHAFLFYSGFEIRWSKEYTLYIFRYTNIILSFTFKPKMKMTDPLFH